MRGGGVSEGVGCRGEDVGMRGWDVRGGGVRVWGCEDVVEYRNLTQTFMMPSTTCKSCGQTPPSSRREEGPGVTSPNP